MADCSCQAPVLPWRGHVSLLFTDLCDYTSLGEQHDPEEVDALRCELEHLVAQVVARHGGSVSQMYGDGILAVFGLPVPREDDPRRAVGAAIELRDAVHRLKVRDGKFECRLHCGVHSGLVFARTGDELNGRYILSGDAVSTTARVCAAAQRDEVVVTDVVRRASEGFFSFSSGTVDLTLKGKRVPVSTHRVIAGSGAHTSFQARCNRGLTEFVGRKQELARLNEVLHDSHRTEPRVLLVSGPAGVGKSRLLEELRRQNSAADRRILHGYSEAYGDVVPLQPFVQMQRQLSGIAEPAASTHAFIALIRALSDKSPVALVLDDWQWADDASRSLLDALLAEPLPLCVVLATRAPARLGDQPTGCEVVRLAPFDQHESEQMVHALLGAADARSLHQRSGGNPMYLEELCRALPGHAGALPTTLHGVIQARLAALSARDARVLQAASVVGNEFNAMQLAELTRDSSVASALDALVHEGMIYAHEQPNEYGWKHGFAREVIYESVRLSERHALHAACAASLLRDNAA